MRGRPVRGWTPAGRKPRHKVTAHTQVVGPRLEDLMKLPGLRLADGSGVEHVVPGAPQRQPGQGTSAQ